MDRSAIFTAAMGVAVVCVIIAILFLVGVMPPDQKVHVKHAILAFGLAILAGLFGLANRRRTA